MATRVDIRHRFHVDADTFWEKFFADVDFNRALYLDELQFPGYELLEERTDDAGKVHRKVKTTPRADAPKPVKKVLGEDLYYVEDGTFDPTAKRYSFRIVPSRLPDKISITGSMWAEDKGDKRCDRCVSLDIEVKVFGVGKLIETFVGKTIRDSYDKATTYSNKVAREKGY